MKNIIAVLILLVFVSCKEEQFETEIEEETLIQIVVDLQLADEALKKAVGSEKDSLKERYKKQIFQIHNVSASDVESDLVSLKNRPEIFLEFYEKVVIKLEEMENQESGNE